MSTNTRDEALRLALAEYNRAYVAVIEGKEVPATNEAAHTHAMRKVVAALAAPVEAASAPVESVRCNMGVGCDEVGVCYAEAHGQPEQCPKYAPPAGAVEDAAKLLDEYDAALLHSKDARTIRSSEAVAALRNELLAALATPATRQYYYRVNACKAANHKTPDCLCWHDEGTGPLADTPKHIREWRTKPAAGQGYTTLAERREQRMPEQQARVDGKRVELREFAARQGGEVSEEMIEAAIIGTEAPSDTGISHRDYVIAVIDAALSARPAAGDGEAVAWQYRWKCDPTGFVYNTFVHPIESNGRTDDEIEWWVYGVKPTAREGVPEGWKVEYSTDPGVMVITTPDQKSWITTRGDRLFAFAAAIAAAPTAGEGSKDG